MGNKEQQMNGTVLQPLKNCLRNEIVIVKHVPRESSMIGNNPRHVLSEGMAENSYRELICPVLRNGQLVDVLTKEEKAYLEKVMGLPDDALSIYRQDNYWKKRKVRLYKTGNRLDLSNPEDYISYKILLANQNLICPNLTALADRPKASYEYVLIAEDDEAKASMKRMGARKEAYMEYGKIEDDIPTMRVVIEALTGRAVAPTAKKEQLVERIDTLIENDANTFLRVVRDPMLKTKVLIREAVQAGVVVDRAGNLFIRDGNVPMCDSGDSTLSVAAAWLNQNRNQEIKFSIEAKIKAQKELE